MAPQDPQFSDLSGQLGRIEGKLDSLLDSVEAHVKADNKIFHGEGGLPGLIVQVDRLTQTSAAQRRTFWLAFSAMITVLIDAVARILHLV